MKTAIQELIHFIEKDKMQSSYIKQQLLELLNFKLEKEKEQIINAYEVGSENGYNLGKIDEFEPNAKIITAEQYYYSIIEIIL
jgi:hypothetical protein